MKSRALPVTHSDLRQAKFIARGMKSLNEAKQRNDFVDADAVVEKLRQRLANAKELLRSRNGDAK